MKKLTLGITLLLVMASTYLNAQRNCGHTEMMEMRKQDPEYVKRLEAVEKHTQDYIQNKGTAKAASTIITIPVVVHVVYAKPEQNINDAAIFSQIEVLNEDFRRLNANADNAWPQAADTEIEFCLASVDPNGNPTNGILPVLKLRLTLS